MSLVGAIISAFFNAWLLNIENNPLILLHFVVPILMIFLAVLALGYRSKRTKLDSLPQIDQRKEKFVIPNDFLSREVESINKEDYRHFLDPMIDDLMNMDTILKELNALKKRFSKYERMSQSNNPKRREMGLKRERQVFDDILKLYKRAGDLKFTSVEVETREKGRIL